MSPLTIRTRSSFEVVEEAEDTGGAEGFGLVHVVESGYPSATRPAVGLDQGRQISDRERDAIVALSFELTDQQLQDWHLPDRHKRLRDHDREGLQAASRPPARITARIPSNVVDG